MLFAFGIRLEDPERIGSDYFDSFTGQRNKVLNLKKTSVTM